MLHTCYFIKAVKAETGMHLPFEVHYAPGVPSSAQYEAASSSNRPPPATLRPTTDLSFPMDAYAQTPVPDEAAPLGLHGVSDTGAFQRRYP